MSIEQTTRGGIGSDVDLDSDLAELRGALTRVLFPAQQDDVLATLVRQQAPSRLLWRVGALSRTRRYHSLDELCGEIGRPTGHGSPPPPGW